MIAVVTAIVDSNTIVGATYGVESPGFNGLDMPVYLLSDELVFPPPELSTKEGLVAVGGDLSPERLMLAYQNGIFPWYSEDDPILWWSPDPRLVLYPDELRISRSLAKTLRKTEFRVTFDTHFEHIIRQCARTGTRRHEGTWITDEMAEAYITLHHGGYAHSVETWHQDDIVGGLYGVSLGGSFFGESMYSTLSNASKVALVYLRDFLKKHDFDLIDCQLPSDHLLSLGAREIARADFLSQLRQSLRKKSLVDSWQNIAT